MFSGCQPFWKSCLVLMRPKTSQIVTFVSVACEMSLVDDDMNKFHFIREWMKKPPTFEFSDVHLPIVKCSVCHRYYHVFRLFGMKLRKSNLQMGMLKNLFSKHLSPVFLKLSLKRKTFLWGLLLSPLQRYQDLLAIPILDLSTLFNTGRAVPKYPEPLHFLLN